MRRRAVPAQLFVGRPNEVVCLEQRLAGESPRVRSDAARSTSPASTSPSTASRSTPPASARPSSSPSRERPRTRATGVNLGDDERDQTDASAADDDAEVVARFNLTLAGLADVPDGTAGTLASTVSVLPAGRYYEIVWYELERVVPTRYSGAVETIIREGEKLSLDDYEIDYRIDNLVEGEAIFFPCTNFVAGPFCEEAGITA